MSTILLLIVLLAAGHIEGTAVCTRKLNVVFIVDTSSTICEGIEGCPNWNYSLQFVKNIVNSLIIGPDDTRVAFMTMSDEPHVEWGFNKHKDKTSLLSAIDRVAYAGGELKKAAANSRMVTHILFDATTGNRFGTPKVVIAITDGVKDVGVNLVAAETKAVRMTGVNIFMVCVTERCSELLAQTAVSPPKQAYGNYFLVDNYLSIDSVREKLVKQICAI